MDAFKTLDLHLILAQMASFTLVFFLLRKYLWVPSLKALDARRDKIAGELKAVETAKDEMTKLKKDYEEHLARIDEEALVKLQNIQRVGEEKARETREKAREEADRIIEDAKGEIRYEFLKSRDALKKDVVEMVVSVTEKMIQEKLTFEDDRKIIEEMLSELDKAHEK